MPCTPGSHRASTSFRYLLSSRSRPIVVLSFLASTTNEGLDQGSSKEYKREQAEEQEQKQKQEQEQEGKTAPIIPLSNFY